MTHTDMSPRISVTEYIQLLNKLDGLIASVENINRRMKVIEEAKRLELTTHIDIQDAQDNAKMLNELRPVLQAIWHYVDGRRSTLNLEDERDDF